MDPGIRKEGTGSEGKGLKGTQGKWVKKWVEEQVMESPEIIKLEFLEYERK